MLMLTAMQARWANALKLLTTLCLVAGGASTFAQDPADSVTKIRQRGQLTAGVNYVVPAYVATTKFRTPEAIDTALAEDIARRLNLTLTTVHVDGRNAPRLSGTNNGTGAGKADFLLASFSGVAPSLAGAVIIPTGYAAGPMAIMRSDTTIKAWDHLKGRKVCLSEGGSYVGTVAAKYGAIEIVHKAPADALLALRTGECDAAVHDNVMLEELLKLPEWKKFSARLPVGSGKTLAFVVPASDTAMVAYLRQVTQDWQATGYLPQLMKKAARSIAFEIYLDQEAPDCH